MKAGRLVLDATPGATLADGIVSPTKRIVPVAARKRELGARLRVPHAPEPAMRSLGQVHCLGHVINQALSSAGFSLSTS